MWCRCGGDLSAAFGVCAEGVTGYGGDRPASVGEEVWRTAVVQPDHGGDLPGGMAFDASKRHAAVVYGVPAWIRVGIGD